MFEGMRMSHSKDAGVPLRLIRAVVQLTACLCQGNTTSLSFRNSGD